MNKDNDAMDWRPRLFSLGVSLMLFAIGTYAVEYVAAQRNDDQMSEVGLGIVEVGLIGGGILIVLSWLIGAKSRFRGEEN